MPAVIVPESSRRLFYGKWLSSTRGYLQIDKDLNSRYYILEYMHNNGRINGIALCPSKPKKQSA
jgi:hypothetical protein